MSAKRHLNNRNLKKYRKKRVSNTLSNDTNSFGSQKLDFSKMIFFPEDYVGLFVTFYIIVIPYIVGATFLFVTIAGTSLDNFMLLDMTKFFIVWAIGYEIVAGILLFSIFVSFLKFNKQNSKQF